MYLSDLSCTSILSWKEMMLCTSLSPQLKLLVFPILEESFIKIISIREGLPLVVKQVGSLIRFVKSKISHRSPSCVKIQEDTRILFRKPT